MILGQLLIYTIMLLAALRLIAYKRKQRLLLVAVALAISYLLFSIEGSSIYILMAGIPIFCLALYSYGEKWHGLSIALALLYLLLMYGNSTVLLSQSALIGLLSGASLPRRKKRSYNKATESRRNATQGLAGLVFIASLYMLGEGTTAMAVILMLLLGLYVGGIVLKDRHNRLSRSLYRLERSATDFGEGAIWLGIGALLAVSFLNLHSAAIVFSAIFIADSASTIVGVNHGRHKLPYNKQKSLEGSASYFIVFLIAYYIISGSFPAAAILFAGIGALAESAPWHIDDNFDVSLILTILLSLP